MEWSLSYGPLFQANTLKNTLWYKAGLQPNIFCLHNRWNGPEVAKLFLNKKPYYFTILRDPITQLISTWDYYGLKNSFHMSLEEFAVSDEKNSQKLRKCLM